ncbi:peptidylprolyl isomerase [Bacillus changyiensis]|uniref:peptidylprolyl isomerase n=1 Tax=Bacillus changyiensis TaxID=3004103 RepID=UPI0022DF0B30|nr:peptidylprolyl isomerase [Bacillus changyiensis]MDA1476030.1 peptidylprolyl isomerase [Bacillus changyiensis]
MKKMVIAAVTATSILTLSACKGGDSEVVAETKYGNITKEDLYKELKDRYGANGISIIAQKKALTDKYKVSDKEIEKKLDEYRKNPQYKTYVKNHGEDKLKDEIKTQLLIEKAAKDNVKVEDKEVKAYYDSLKGKIRASHILVNDKKTINEVQKKLKKGEKFEDLAKEYSQDPSGQNGGDLGWFEKGKMEKPFEKSAFALKTGEISQPVKTSHGYHLIKKTEERGKYEDMKKDLEKQLLEQKQNDGVTIQEVLKKFEEEAKIKTKDKEIKGQIEDQKTQMQNGQG